MSQRRERRDLDPALERLVAAKQVDIPREPSLLREPARALIAVGSIFAIAASALPWATRSEIAGDVGRTGWQGLADGFLIALAALAALVLTFGRWAVESKDRVVRRLPAILGVVAFLIWTGGLRGIDAEIAYWRRGGYDGAYEPWLFVCLGGVLTFAAGGLWLWMRPGAGRELPAGRGPGVVATVRTHGSTLVVAGFSIAGAVVAAVAVDIAILGSSLHPLAVMMPLILGTVFAGWVGANLGGRIGRRLVGALGLPQR